MADDGRSSRGTDARSAQHRHQGGGRDPPVRRGRARPTGWRPTSTAIAGPLEVRQFKGGQSNPTYQLITPAQEVRHAPQAAGQAAAVGARGRPRIPGDHGALPDRLSGRQGPMVCAPTRASIGTMFYVMDMVEGRILWDQTLPDLRAGRAPRRSTWRALKTLADLHNTDYKAIGLERLRPHRQLHGPPDRPLDQAVQGLRDPAHRHHRAADRMAAEDLPGGRPDLDRPRRLPAGQHGHASHRAAGGRRAGLGARRRSAIRWPTSPTC